MRGKSMSHNVLNRFEDLTTQSVTMQQEGDLAGALANYEVILENIFSHETNEYDKRKDRILCRILNAQPAPGLVFYIYSLSLYFRRQYQAAFMAVEMALLLSSDIPQLHLLKARILDAFGNTKESEPLSDSEQEALFLSQAEHEMPGMDYYGWLQRLHALLQPSTYVEIGLGDGRALSLTGPKTVAIGIDPYKGKWEYLNYGSPHGSTSLYYLTSDDFFEHHDLRHVIKKDTFDIAFIDGLHHFDQVLKDFINLERYAGEHSIILMHDCLPVSPAVATRERNTAFWTGDVWRIIPCLKTFRPDLNIITIPAKPSGLTVVTHLDSESRVLSENYEAIIQYYAGLNLPISMSERFALLNVQNYDWDTFAGAIINSNKIPYDSAEGARNSEPRTDDTVIATGVGQPDRYRTIKSPGHTSLPQVSIISVICGNNIDFMGKCLQSLIDNTDYPNLEIIIVTDSGPEMKHYLSNIAASNPAIKCIFRPTRHSNSSNRNFGALHASPDSKYLLFVDSDVMYSNNQWLTNQVEILENNSEIGMIGGGEANTIGHYCFIDENSGVLMHIINEFNDLIQGHCTEMMIIPGYNMLMRKDIYTAIGGWDEGFTPVYGEDVDICLRCILAGHKIFGMFNKGVHHLYRNSKENNSSELLPSGTIQDCLNLAAMRRLALKYEGILPTKEFGSFNECFDALEQMRKCGQEYTRRIKVLPPTIVDGKINNLYLPLINTLKIGKMFDAINLNQ